MKYMKPYNEGILDFFNKEKLEVGDICIFHRNKRGSDKGLPSYVGKECIITRFNYKDSYMIGFNIKNPRSEFYADYDNLTLSEKGEDRRKRKEEMSLKMRDIDPYMEDDWTSENKKHNMLTERKLEYKKELCQDIWDGTTLKEKIEKKLIKLAKDFFNDIELETEVLDIHLTGSMVNFNYNAESDIDVHIVIDFKDVNEDVELVKMAVDGQRFIWNMRHHIQIKGHDVELYIMDVDEEHISNGLYSLTDGKWIKKPKYSPPDVDTEDIKPKYDARVYDILKFEKLSKSDLSETEAEEYYKSASDLKAKIMKARKLGLHVDGEFSIENLVFKKLRKTGKFKKLLDTIGRLYDKIYSQD